MKYINKWGQETEFFSLVIASDGSFYKPLPSSDPRQEKGTSPDTGNTSCGIPAVPWVYIPDIDMFYVMLPNYFKYSYIIYLL